MIVLHKYSLSKYFYEPKVTFRKYLSIMQCLKHSKSKLEFLICIYLRSIYNQYYCNRSFYINYIYRIIFHGTSLKKPSMVESIACLLTEIGDAGLSPHVHVAKVFFLMIFHDKLFYKCN